MGKGDSLLAVHEEEDGNMALYDMGNGEETGTEEMVASGVSGVDSGAMPGGSASGSFANRELPGAVSELREEEDMPLGFGDDVYGNVDLTKNSADDAAPASDTEAELTAADVGCRVQVQGYSCLGTLRFVGQHKTKNGLRLGVALDEPQGLNNGTVAVSYSDDFGGGDDGRVGTPPDFAP
jgi:hypothetical protein